MCEILQSYIKKGRDEGQEKAIGIFVKSCLKKGMEKNDVLNQVMDYFEMDRLNAEKIVEDVLKVFLVDETSECKEI